MFAGSNFFRSLFDDSGAVSTPFGVFRAQLALYMRASPPARQAPLADQVVDRETQQQLGTQLCPVDQFGFAQRSHRLQPAKAFLDPLAELQADRIPRMTRRASVDGAALFLTRHMRRHLQFARTLDKGLLES